MKHFFTPGGWREYVRGFCWFMGSWLVYDVFALLGLVPCWILPLCTLLCSRKWSGFISDISAVNLIVEWKLFAFSTNIFRSLFCLDLCSIGNTHRQYTTFCKTASQYHWPWVPRDFLRAVSGSVKSLWWPTRKAFFLAALPLATSAFGQRSVGLQPKHPAARDKNPLVTRVRFTSTLSLYWVFYSGHEDVSKRSGHLCSHGCSIGL